MKKNKVYFVFLVVVLILISSCMNREKEETLDIQKDSQVVIEPSKRIVETKMKQNYDISEFSGKAEICSYSLERARYEGLHPGEAVLIFVSEPFLLEKQVKADDWKNRPTIPVLKMNRIDRFTTGIYDYSMFTSVFTPVSEYDARYPLKITFSSQDWCGQSYMQLNNNKGFDVEQYSYFESEGDTSFHQDYAITEDNIFNMARIDLDLLPTGAFKIQPSFNYIRSSHKENRAYHANASIGEQEGLMVYNCEIPELRRSLRIFLDPKKNNRIVKWTETYPTIFDGKLRTSTYKLKVVKKAPYWSLNAVGDKNWRDSLNLKKE